MRDNKSSNCVEKIYIFQKVYDMILSMYKLINLLFIVFYQFCSAEGAEQDLDLAKAVQTFGEMVRLVQEIALNSANDTLDSKEEINRLTQISPDIDYKLWLSPASDAWDTKEMRSHLKKLRLSFHYHPYCPQITESLSKSTWCGMQEFLVQGVRLSRWILKKDINNHNPTFPTDWPEHLLFVSCYYHNNLVISVRDLPLEGFDGIDLDEILQPIFFQRPWRDVGSTSENIQVLPSTSYVDEKP